jgi:DnaJ-class molecular chaperone
MEQVKAPARAYHQQMKRELPVTCCTECGGAGYNMMVANGRCCKTSGEQRCSGINAIAFKTLDWSECTHCQATGYYRNKECPNCKGVGYLFVGLRDKATVETRHFQMDRRKGLA